MPVHVHPENDIVDHDLTTECACHPEVRWKDGDEPLPNGPLVIHHSLDGRESAHRLEVRPWLCTEVDAVNDGPGWWAR